MAADLAPIVVVVGNPQAASRTRTAGEAVAAVLAEHLDPAPPIEVVELAEVGPALLAWGDPEVDRLRALVGGARALVVASPTYKAAYTGVLKLFLDRFEKGELAGLPTVALMTGGSPHHALAVEVHLAPVLVEIGASLPTRGLYVCGPEVDDPGPVIARWHDEARRALGAALAPVGSEVDAG
jgi:FMN reductase